ncbi:MAG: ABC transporter ATP-binding protein [Bifidobacterium animalis]|nr:ABC transporter ATP-binding protein [Bifidobacterium animalis]MDY5040942.1 ABC transporter ATP-binding protein [Bifidobacterium animalis]
MEVLEKPQTVNTRIGESNTCNLEVFNVSMKYTEDGPQILKDISFHTKPGEFVTFVGPSGCGKSTLFNIVAGLLNPTCGGVVVDYKETTGTPCEKIGYVLQKDLLLPWRTILQNVTLGPELRHCKVDYARIEQLFDTYHLSGYESSYPDQLSGGMRQRAALMRAMLMEPEILLMDEAYKALDYPLKIALESELLEHVKESGQTVVFVTHDIEEAVTLSDRVYILKAHPGEIVDEFEIHLSCDSTKINERRLAPEFNTYYERIWRTVESGQRS